MQGPETDAAADLERQFGLGGTLRFRSGEDGLVFVGVRNDLAAATLSLQGGQLLRWQPRAQAAPVLWMSDAARFAAGKTIRGGAPVCWPWFGPHPDGAPQPSHGFVRTRPWRLSAAARDRDGATRLTLAFDAQAAAGEAWPGDCTLTLELCIGAALELRLTTANRGEAPLAISEALHTYLHVSDVGEVHIDGLDGVAYLDSAAGGRAARQDGPVRFAAELDRVYLDAPSACTLVDPGLRRLIRVEQEGAATTVVWNPWQAKAERLGDLGGGTGGRPGWREMACIESSNAVAGSVVIAPGARHTLVARYAVEAND